MFDADLQDSDKKNSKKDIKKYNWVGYTASFVGLLSFIPLLTFVYRTSITRNFPYSALYLTLLGWFLMAAYGFLDKNIPSMTLGMVYFCIFAYILYIKIISPSKFG